MALETVDTAIGIVFFFCLFSILCTAVSEVIEAFLKKRAEFLWRGVCTLLNDDKLGSGIVKKIYEHPLVFGLVPAGSSDPAPSNLPSYIPAGSFSLALLGVVLEGNPSFNELATTAIPGGTISPAGRGAITQALAQRGYLGRALIQLADSAGWDPVQFRKNIEAWYDAAMDRVAGWYKRHAQFIIFCIALPTAALLNADSIDIAHALSSNPALRQAAVEQAKSCLNDPGCRTPSGTQPNPKPTESIESAMKAVEKLGLPLGWDDQPLPNGGKEWVLKVLGFLITALAAILGAPFWFDVLNKVMIVRSTVKPKEKSPDEPPVG